MVQEVILNGRPHDLDYDPSLKVGTRQDRTPIEINGRMVHGVNINGYDYPPADSGCVLYYPGLPGYGSTIWNMCSGGSAGNGTITGATWVREPSGLWALDFVAASKDYVEIPAAYDQLDFTSEDFSFVIRAKSDSTAATARLYYRGSISVDGFGITIGSDRRVYIHTHQSGQYQQSFTNTNAITAGSWYTIGISRDGASILIYINGIVNTGAAGTHQNPATCGRSAKIGIYDDKSGGAFDGEIEFLKVIKGIAMPASSHLAWHNFLK